jgi:cell division protein FtsL
MMLYTIAIVTALAVGFGLGRIKNKAKLAAIKAELVKVESSISTEVKSLVSAIKAKL